MHRLTLAAFALALLTGCSDHGRVATLAADELYEVRRLVLAEPDSAPVARIVAAAGGPDGTLLVLDDLECRLRRYDQSGELLGSAGRCGAGPGEFVMPLSVAADAEGRVYVGDATPRVTRFGPDLSLDTTFSVDGFRGIRQLAVAGDLLVGPGIGLTPTPGEPTPHEFLVLRIATLELATFSPAPPERFLPYWNSSWFTSFALLPNGDVVVAGSMAYPLATIRIGEGGRAPFGEPPPSYRAPTQPAYGAFAPPHHDQADDWLTSFTDIGGVWLIEGDGRTWLGVSHYEKELRPDRMGFLLRDIRMDLYEDGRKRSADIPLPGRPLGVAGGQLLLLTSEPPEGWTVTFMSVRRRGDR